MLDKMGVGWGRERALWLGAALAAIVYVALGLTPSSYALVFRGFGFQDDPGLVAGTPRALRSDEFALLTPLIQATIDSGFGPINQTSAYHEPLRTAMPLPLADWALPFKPIFWGFFLLPPAQAYSFYFAVTALAFWLGYVLLLKRLGLDPALAWTATAVLFFSSFVQAWWTTFGPHVALLPWIFLAFLLPTGRPWRLVAALFYATTAWQLCGLFHPPMLLNFGLGALALTLAFRYEEVDRRRLALAAVALAVSAAVVWLYLREPLALMAGAKNLGQRQVSAGLVAGSEFAGLFFPSFPSWNYVTLYGRNFCEASSAGSYAFLLFLCCIDWRRVAARWREEPETQRLLCRRSLFLLVPSLAMIAWMLLPLPIWAGIPFLWNKVFAGRLLFPVGLMLLGLLLVWARFLPFRLTISRCLLCAAVVVAVWYPTAPVLPFERTFHPGVLPFQAPTGLWEPFADIYRHSDLWLLPLLGAWLGLRWLLGASRVATGTAALAVAAAANALAFFGYNPVQSAGPIFARPTSPKLAALAERQAAHPENLLVVGGAEYHGAVLNGYGFRSLAHVLVLPQPQFFRSRFPRMKDREFDRVFNRLGFFMPSSLAPPFWDRRLTSPTLPIDNGILFPPDPFLPERRVWATDQPAIEVLPLIGEVTAVEVEGQLLKIDFWGRIDGVRGETTVRIHFDRTARILERWLRPRLDPVDVERDPLIYSRYVVQIELEKAAALGEPPAFCIQVVDARLGDSMIAPPAALARNLCPPSPAASAGPG